MDAFVKSVCVYTLILFGNTIPYIDGSPLDFVLLMDSSDQFRSTNFVNEIRFAKNLVGQLYQTDVQIGMYTFGNGAFSQFTLDMYSDLTQMEQSIEYMWYSTGNGDAMSALNTTVYDAFVNSHGDRECVPNMLVILTHSPFNDDAAARTMRDMLAANRIRTFVLNMAGSSAVTNFETVTNGRNRVISIGDFTALEKEVANILTTLKLDIPGSGCGKFADWEKWTRCSASCGDGQRFRLRKCIKEIESDKDCDGKSLQYEPCSMPVCTDPVDGGWSEWDSWNSCSKTCNNGVQKRRRRCNAPVPKNGGNTCPGVRNQTRTCAEWKCPDCSKTCPPGAHLSSNCESCECSSVNILGRIMNDVTELVRNASIFLESGRFSPIATTNDMGRFSRKGICIVGEEIYIKANGHAGQHVIPTEVNATHWTIQNVTLLKYVPPVIKSGPHSKVRMVGQDVTMCCSAVGRPMPTEYKWFKNNVELENLGTNGNLSLVSLQKSDDGSYHCYVETDAGVTLSETVTLAVKDNAVDSCGASTSKLRVLPDGCFVAGDNDRNNTVDVGTCGKAECVKNILNSNGSCSEWWPHHCCDAKETELVDIQCAGFSFKLSRVKSCECNVCKYVTTVSGRSFGRANGTEVPLKYGDLAVGGKKIARTNSGGFFHFQLPKGTKRVVITFHDPLYKKFLPVTKIAQVNDGSETFITAVIPLKPRPIHFDTTNGTEITFGEDNNGLPAVGAISISKNSLTSSNGEPYKGRAKVTLKYMDPRKMESLDEANGDFEAESPGGRKLPLKTFGIINLGIHDENGEELNSISPVRISLDASMFPIPHDNDGNPDVNMWSYNIAKGIWVDKGKLRYANASYATRRLLESSTMLEVDIIPDKLPVTQLDSVTYKETWKVPSNPHNFDNLESNVTIRDAKTGGCFVGVSVYKDMSLREPYDENDLTVSVYVKDKGTYISKSTARALKRGHVCVEMFCNKFVTITVERKSGERLLPAKHFVPPMIQPKSSMNDSVTFEALLGGNSIDCDDMYYEPGTDCRGPVYDREEENICHRQEVDGKSFQIKFAPFTAANSKPSFTESENSYNKRLSWSPIPPSRTDFRACFIKVRVNVQENYDMQFVAKSIIGDKTGDEFGTMFVAPIPDSRPDQRKFGIRAACIEYRCPGLIQDGKTQRFDVATIVDAHFLYKNDSLNCTMSYSSIGLNVTSIAPNSTGSSRGGFRFISPSGMNYGPNYGIFINDDHSDRVQQFCYSGNDRGSKVNAFMLPTVNYAIVFDCN